MNCIDANELPGDCDTSLFVKEAVHSDVDRDSGVNTSALDIQCMGKMTL